jgi:hypothetical protein
MRPMQFIKALKGPYSDMPLLKKIALAKMISITFKNYFVTQILHDK